MTLTDNVTLVFRYSQQDYVRAMRSHYATRLRLPMDLIVVIVGAGLGVYLWHSGSESYGIALLCLVCLFSLMLIAAFTIIPQIAFRREPKFRDDYTLTFSPTGIHFRTANVDSKLQWSLYTSALVDAHSFILYYGGHQFTVVPKRVFHDVAQREAFERLLAANVSAIAEKTK